MRAILGHKFNGARARSLMSKYMVLMDKIQPTSNLDMNVSSASSLCFFSGCSASELSEGASAIIAEVAGLSGTILILILCSDLSLGVFSIFLFSAVRSDHKTWALSRIIFMIVG